MDTINYRGLVAQFVNYRLHMHDRLVEDTCGRTASRGGIGAFGRVVSVALLTAVLWVIPAFGAGLAYLLYDGGGGGFVTRRELRSLGIVFTDLCVRIVGLLWLSSRARFEDGFGLTPLYTAVSFVVLTVCVVFDSNPYARMGVAFASVAFYIVTKVAIFSSLPVVLCVVTAFVPLGLQVIFAGVFLVQQVWNHCDVMYYRSFPHASDRELNLDSDAFSDTDLLSDHESVEADQSGAVGKCDCGGVPSGKIDVQRGIESIGGCRGCVYDLDFDIRPDYVDFPICARLVSITALGISQCRRYEELRSFSAIDHSPAWVRSEAWVGDRALSYQLALMHSDLPVEDLSTLSTSAFTNKNLALYYDRYLRGVVPVYDGRSDKSKATFVESLVGAHVRSQMSDLRLREFVQLLLVQSNAQISAIVAK